MFPLNSNNLKPEFCIEIVYREILFYRIHIYVPYYSCHISEPGYYEDGAFGIRTENVVLTVPAETKVNYIRIIFGLNLV